MQPAAERIQRVGATLRNHFHAAIGEVARMPDEAEFARARLGRGAEEHALHETGSEKASGRHAGYFAGVAAAIAFSRSFVVTGPVKRFATRPSGAIR